MGLVDSFNEITEKINKAVNDIANKVEQTTTNVIQNSNTNDQSAVVEGSLDKLGAINLTTNGEPMETPRSFLEKTDTDNRKLATDLSRFTTIESYKRYLENYFVSTELFNVEKSDYNNCFCIQLFQNPSNEGLINRFRIFAVLSTDDVKVLMDNIKASNITDNTEKFVALGYFRYDKYIKKEADQLGLELFGAEEINEVNEAIDIAEKKLPYISISKNALHNILANALNNKYRALMAQTQAQANNNGFLQNTQNNMNNGTVNGNMPQQGFVVNSQTPQSFGSVEGLGAKAPETVNTTTNVDSGVDLSKH